jgi:hypothetical protein
MGTILASAIINKAANQLTDSTNVRWTRAELLGWLNDGQRQIVLMTPASTNKVQVVQLVAGTRQSIPTDGWTLLEVIRSMGFDGLKPGRAIRLASQEVLDAYNPNWHSATPSPVPQSYLFNLQDQTAFYVYPPNTGTGYVQINYSAVPADLPSESTAISVSNVFQTALLDYILYRACSKDAEYAPGLQLASGYLTAFMATMGQKEKSELSNSPNLALEGRNPALVGGES